MAKDAYNMVVVGAGAAGLVTTYIGLAVKAKVALVERHKMGGDCLNYGCVPSKTLIRTAKFVHEMRNHKALGVKDVRFSLDFADVMARVHQKIAKIAPVDSAERYAGLGAHVLQGQAEILDPHTVRVGQTTLSTRNIVLALGASPFVPPIKGLKDTRYLTSETLWDLKTLPRRLIVLGGGPIGCELAQAFQRLGSQVTQVEKLPRLLPREDEDVARYVADFFAHEGIQVRVGAEAVEVTQKGDERHLLIRDAQGRTEALPFDEILVAVGRKANTDGVDWRRLGIALNPNGTVHVDAYMRTAQKNIYACGDVAGPYQFTHVASHQAWYCAVNALFSPFKSFAVDYRVIPWATYTDPEVARVGLNEMEAREKGIPHEVTLHPLDHLDRAIAESENHGFIKILTEPGKDRILGATVVGHLGGELIAGFVNAMKHGYGLNKILGTIHAYPTYMEANKLAAGTWKKAHAPAWALRLLSHYHAWRR